MMELHWIVIGFGLAMAFGIILLRLTEDKDQLRERNTNG